jgi:serine/threonine-protein kinase
MTNQTREQRKMLYERLIGTHIAEKFRITGLLGFGGMGAVYEAVQAPMERKVALKLIPSSDPTAAARFEREAYTISKLSHPNTVTLYDFGQANDGYLYLAMEYLEGKTLTDEIRRHGPLGAQRAIHIASQICRSLGEAHRAGIIHRDVKPDNIFLISVDGDADYVKVLDFGIAKAVAGEEDVSLTADGRIIGTPRYMSPEQILAQPVDHRADIYSLGCIIFEMLCGGPPFEQSSTAALMMSHAQQSPPSFSERLTEAQLQAIPPGLENVVRRAMAKNPAQRPQTTDELRKELEQALRIHSAYTTGGLPHVGGTTGERPFYPTPTGGFGPPSGSYPPLGQYPTGQHQPSGYTGQHTGSHTGQRPQPQFPGPNPTGNFEHHTGDHPRQTGSYPRPQDSGSHTGQQATPTKKGKAALFVVVAVLLGLMGFVGYKISQSEEQAPPMAPVALAGANPLKGTAPADKPADKPPVKEEPAPAEPKQDDKESADVVGVVISSEPDKASIFIHGAKLGQTPYTVPVPKNGGIATYTLRMDGYEDLTVAINPLDEPRDLHVKLDREKKRPAYTSRKPDDKPEKKPEKKPDAVVTPPPEDNPPEVKKPKVEMINDKPKTKIEILE